jgi:autotransporter-associated beta strand protein
VRFDDTATITAVTLDVPVLPSSVTFSNNTTAYTLNSPSGAGVISGAASLTKQGTNSLTINNTNNFTGTVAINAGLLTVGNPSALGATNGMVTIASGGTLNLNAIGLGTKPVTVQGVGYDGNGAIINNNSNVATGLQYVTLNGDTTLGCPFRWDISGYGANAGFINGGTHTLTKTGNNALALHTGTAVTAGNIVVNQGYLILGDTSTLNSGYPLTMGAGTTLQLYNQQVPLSRVVNLGANANIQATANPNNNTVITGGLTLNTVGNVSSDGTSLGLTLGGAVTGTGNLVISGITPVVLTSLANNWTGGLIISNASLYIGDGQTSVGSLPTSLAITNLASLCWYPPTNTTITPSQDVVGTGTIWKSGSGTLVLNHAYSWTGAFNVGGRDSIGNSVFTTNGGIVQLLNGNGFGDGSTAKTVTIIRSEVDLSGGITIPAGISLRTSGSAAMTGDGAGLVPLRNVSGTNTVAGSIEAYYGVGGGSEYRSDAGLLQLNGQVFLGNNTPRIDIFSGAGNGVVNGVITNQTTNALSVTMNGPGTWTFTATNTYAGPTLVQGGTLLINGVIGTNSVTVTNSSTLGGTGTIGGAVTYNTGSHAVLTLGSPLTLSSSLIVSNGADVHLKMTNSVPVGNYTLATYNVTGSSGAFNTNPVIDSGSLAGTSIGVIVTSGGIVQLQVTAAAPTTPPNFPPGGVSVLPSGNISLVATGAVGGTYKLWATTNLTMTPVTNTWTLLHSGTINTSPFTNIDLTATNYPQRFYLFSTP